MIKIKKTQFFFNQDNTFRCEESMINLSELSNIIKDPQLFENEKENISFFEEIGTDKKRVASFCVLNVNDDILDLFKQKYQIINLGSYQAKNLHDEQVHMFQKKLIAKGKIAKDCFDFVFDVKDIIIETDRILEKERKPSHLRLV